MVKIVVLVSIIVALASATTSSSATIADSEITIDQRIVGGDEVSIVNHNHQISLRVRNCIYCTYNHKCGGTIYNDDTIITAAHCVYGRAINDLIVVAGSNNRNGADGSVARVAKVIVHDKYNASTTDYDVALMFLDTKLPIDRVKIGVVRGLVTERPAPGVNATVTGWGTTSEGGVASPKLLLVTVPIVSNESCLQAYGADSFTESMLCAGSDGKDACQDDSGGPLMVDDELAGITSWAIGCARPEYPGVYTNVAMVKDWIDATAKENSVNA